MLRRLASYTLILTLLFGGTGATDALPVFFWADAGEEEDETPQEESAKKREASELKKSSDRRHRPYLDGPPLVQDIPAPIPPLPPPAPPRSLPALPCFQPRMQI